MWRLNHINQSYPSNHIMSVAIASKNNSTMAVKSETNNSKGHLSFLQLHIWPECHLTTVPMDLLCNKHSASNMESITTHLKPNPIHGFSHNDCHLHSVNGNSSSKVDTKQCAYMQRLLQPFSLIQRTKGQYEILRQGQHVINQDLYQIPYAMTIPVKMCTNRKGDIKCFIDI